MSNLYILPTYNGVNKFYEESVRYFKGKTDIIYDLSQVESTVYTIIKVNIDFNDNSPLYKDEYDYINKNKLKTNKIIHTYYPINESENIFYYPTLNITFSNFETYTYQTPIRITKESFYTKYQNVELHDMQFIDNTENSLFVTLNSINGDILNLKIK